VLSNSGTAVNGVIVLGKGNSAALYPEEEVALDNLGNCMLPQEQTIKYNRCIIGNKIFSTENYDIPFKRRNCGILVGNSMASSLLFWCSKNNVTVLTTAIARK